MNHISVQHRYPSIYLLMILYARIDLYCPNSFTVDRVTDAICTMSSNITQNNGRNSIFHAENHMDWAQATDWLNSFKTSTKSVCCFHIVLLCGCQATEGESIEFRTHVKRIVFHIWTRHAITAGTQYSHARSCVCVCAKLNGNKIVNIQFTSISNGNITKNCAGALAFVYFRIIART